MYSDVKCIDILVLAAKKKISSRKWTSHFLFFLGGGVGGGAIGTTLRLWLRNLARISTKLILRIGVVGATARQPLPSTNSNHNVFSVDVVVLFYRPKHRLGLFLFWFFFFRFGFLFCNKFN